MIALGLLMPPGSTGAVVRALFAGESVVGLLVVDCCLDDAESFFFRFLLLPSTLSNSRI